jgi:hypothetical protein
MRVRREGFTKIEKGVIEFVGREKKQRQNEF